MCDRMVPLDCAPSSRIDGNANSFTGLGRASVGDLRAMNVNIAALLRVEHSQSPDFGAIVAGYVQQPMIYDLAAHLSVTRRAVEHDVQFTFILTRCHGRNDRFGFEKIVTKKLRRCDLEVLVGNGNYLLLLCGARTGALLIHEFFKTGDIDDESTLTGH